MHSPVKKYFREVNDNYIDVSKKIKLLVKENPCNLDIVFFKSCTSLFRSFLLVLDFFLYSAHKDDISLKRMIMFGQRLGF